MQRGTLAMTVVALACGCDAGSGSKPAPSASPSSSAAAPTSGAAAASAGPIGFDEARLGAFGGKMIAGQILDATRHPAQDVVVYVKSGPSEKKRDASDKPAVIDQKDKAFSPRVLPVRVGTTVEFRNSDTVLHNVYSRAKVKTFDLGAFSSAEKKSVTFDEPGRVDVFCSIHTNMHSVILVLDTPHFDATGVDGFFKITDLAPGKYTVVIWDEVGGETEATVEVGEHQAGILKRELAKQ